MMKNKKISQTQDKIGTISMFIFAGIFVILEVFEFYYSLQNYGRFQFQTELTNLIVAISCVLIEGTLLYLDKLRCIKGSSFIIGLYIGLTETSRVYTASNFAITPVTLPAIAASIYVGVAYNKSWIISTISITIGVIYFIIRFMGKVQGVTGFQYLVFVFYMGILELFSIYVFYYNEICLRKNFFSGEVIDEKKESIKEILNMVPIPIVQITNGKILFLNKGMKELLGITNNEDKEIKEFDKSKREEKYKFYLSQIKNTEINNSLTDLINNFSTKEISDKALCLEKNNDKLKFRVRAIEFENVKSKIQILALEDLTYLERIQNETKNKYQKILIASFSHDLLTPINGCLGLIETLIYTARDSWLIKKLTIIKNSSLKLTFYVSLIKYYAMLEGNSLSIDNDAFNCIDVVKECYTLFIHDIKKKKLGIITKFESNRFLVNLDKMKFRQIMFALIENAEKHTFQGNISIEVCIKGNHIDFIVTDTGVGILSNNLKNIFELYGCSNSSNELNPQGIGLSMYVCKRLALLMEGDIIVSSKEHQGSQFILTFSSNILSNDLHYSLDEMENSNIEEEKWLTNRNLMGNQLNVSSEKINIQRINKCKCKKYLIVDDDPTNILVLKEYLKSMKKTYDVAFNGKEALDKVVEKKSCDCCKNYKLIIMDINMPIMDGEEATRAIKKMNKSDSECKCVIIGLTAAQIQDQAHKERFLKAGFNDIFSKPISRKQFKEIVDKY